MNYITYKNTYSENVDHIITDIYVVCDDKTIKTIALWDTGAARTHITENIVKKLKLRSIGSVNTLSHGGNVSSEKYVITLILPTNGQVEDITVLSTTNAKYKGYDIGVIIGMDIIQCGDFHIDHINNKTVFTFRHLSGDADDEVLIETNLF